MHKSVLLICLVLSVLSFSLISAEGETTAEEAVAFETSAGIGPDSFLYRIDTFLDDTFGDPLDVREERAAELAEALEAGDEEAATEAKEGYDTSAEEAEANIAPEDEERTRRSARAIQGHLKKFDHAYARDVEGREKRLAAAAEVSATIKELCTKLAKLDPEEYARTCRVAGDAPKWQQKLHKELTEEQRQEAEKLVNIMKGCFESNGKECDCAAIEQEAFKATCTEVAPLAASCSEGDEEACTSMEAMGDPFETLPEYLQEIMRGLDAEYQDAQYDHRMPEECSDAGITSPEKCRQRMIQTHAPEACREALADVKNEREARTICDAIMFKEHAPTECVSAGLTSPEACSKLMWNTQAPEQCKEAGLVGERGDERRCEAIMKKFHSEEGNRGPGEGEFRGPALGAQCHEIADPSERLKCFESAFEDVKGREFRGDFQDDRREQFDQRQGDFRNKKVSEMECANSCKQRGEAWDFTNGQCFCRGTNQEFGQNAKRDVGPGGPEGFRDTQKSTGNSCLDEAKARGLSYDEARNKCFGGEKEYKLPPGPGDPNYVDNTAKYDCSRLDCGSSPNYCDPWGGCKRGEESSPPQQSSPSGETSGGSSSESTGGSSGSSSEGSDSSGSGSITGNVAVDVTENNNFLNYFLR